MYEVWVFGSKSPRVIRRTRAVDRLKVISFVFGLVEVCTYVLCSRSVTLPSAGAGLHAGAPTINKNPKLYGVLPTF